MAEQSAKPDQASLGVLIRGAEKMFSNAERLFFEAETLAKAGAVSRALFLHQISLEECSKISSVGAWAVSLLVGEEVDQKKVLAAFGRHAFKNKHNAYMLERSEAEIKAMEGGDWNAAREAFQQAQDEFHKASNDAKNASLYVDFVGSEFAAPSERVTEDMLAETRDRNATFLGYAANELRVFGRLEKAPEPMREILSGFVEKAEKLREEKPDDLVAALDELLVGFFEEAKGKLSK